MGKKRNQKHHPTDLVIVEPRTDPEATVSIDHLPEHIRALAIASPQDLPAEYDDPLNRRALTDPSSLLPPYEPPLTAERIAIAIADEFERRGLATRKESDR